MNRQTIQGYFDLDYVILVDVPMRESKFGPVIDLDPAFIERRIAEEIIRQKVPLRGLEVGFLRKALGLSYEKFAKAFALTSGGLYRWEKYPEKRLDKVNEAAVRSFFAEEFEIPVRGWWNELTSDEDKCERLEVKAA